MTERTENEKYDIALKMTGILAKEAATLWYNDKNEKAGSGLIQYLADATAEELIRLHDIIKEI